MAKFNLLEEGRKELLEEAENLLSEAELLVSKAKFQGSLKNAQKAVALFKRLESWEGYLKSGNCAATNLYYLGQCDSAITLLTDTHQNAVKYIEPDHVEIAKNNAIRGGCYDKMGNLNKALKHFQISMDIVLNIFGENHIQTAFAYNNIASICGQKRYFNKVIFFYEKCIDIFSKTDKKHFALITVYTNLAKVYQNKKDYKTVIIFCQKALELLKEKNEEETQKHAIIYNLLSKVYFELKDYRFIP